MASKIFCIFFPKAYLQEDLKGLTPIEKTSLAESLMASALQHGAIAVPSEKEDFIEAEDGPIYGKGYNFLEKADAEKFIADIQSFVDPKHFRLRYLPLPLQEETKC